jgi:hypothetical protein
MKRYALISTKQASAETIGEYLPSNYTIIGTAEHANPIDASERPANFGPCVVIQGADEAGWTLDGYVLPRLGSGLIVGREIDLSHPVMKTIPADR